MDFSTWLKDWLNKHPVKTPDADKGVYTDQVMARIRAEVRPERKALWGFGFQNLALASAAVAVAVALVMIRQPSDGARLAGRGGPADGRVVAQIGVLEQLGVLAALDEDALDELISDDVSAWVQRSDDAELLMLADDKGVTSDQQWLEQTLSLLEQFDDSASTDTSDETGESEDDWTRELQLLDDVDLTAKL